jgi:hypothetical protein
VFSQVTIDRPRIVDVTVRAEYRALVEAGAYRVGAPRLPRIAIRPDGAPTWGKGRPGVHALTAERTIKPWSACTLHAAPLLRGLAYWSGRTLPSADPARPMSGHLPLPRLAIRWPRSTGRS